MKRYPKRKLVSFDGEEYVIQEFQIKLIKKDLKYMEQVSSEKIEDDMCGL